MDLSADELAGIVDLFGALTREELQEAAAEVSFKRKGEFEPEAFAEDVDDAVRSYHLLRVDAEAVDGPGRDDGGDDGKDGGGDGGGPDEGDWLVPGPIAFPTLPDGATDLPHILEATDRTVDREAAGRAAEERFRADAASAAEAVDDDRIAELLDVSYELEAWAPVELGAARDRLDAALE